MKKFLMIAPTLFLLIVGCAGPSFSGLSKDETRTIQLDLTPKDGGSYIMTIDGCVPEKVKTAQDVDDFLNRHRVYHSTVFKVTRVD